MKRILCQFRRLKNNKKHDNPRKTIAVDKKNAIFGSADINCIKVVTYRSKIWVTPKYQGRKYCKMVPRESTYIMRDAAGRTISSIQVTFNLKSIQQMDDYAR